MFTEYQIFSKFCTLVQLQAVGRIALKFQFNRNQKTANMGSSNFYYFVIMFIIVAVDKSDANGE